MTEPHRIVLAATPEQVAAALESGASGIVPVGACEASDRQRVERALADPVAHTAFHDIHSRAQAAEFVAAIGRVPGRRRELVETAVDELISNALRHASSAQLAIEVTVEHVDVVVVDSAGALMEHALRASLIRGIRSGGVPLQDTGGGAGLGLYLLFRRAAWMHVVVTAGVSTRVRVRIEVRTRVRAFAAISIVFG